MKLYIVWGIEFHAQRTLLGIYDSIEKANDRFWYVKERETLYDDFKVEEIDINTDFE